MFECNRTYSCWIEVKVSPFSFQTVLDIDIRKKCNFHSQLYVKAVIKEEDGNKIIEQPLLDKEVVVKVKQDGEEYCVFSGLVSDVVLDVNAQYRTIEIKALSYTWMMDRKKKQHTYQQRDMPISTLLAGITSQYPASDVRDYASKGDVIGDIYVQYEETDWQLVRRIASRYQAPLIPVDNMECLRYYAGVPDDSKPWQEIDVVSYKVRKSLRDYAYKTENGLVGYTEQNANEYLVKSGCILNLADPVLFNGALLYVKEIESTMKDELFTSEYVLCDKGGLMVRPYYNDLLRGTSFFGNVSDVRMDEIKLTLDIDDDNPLAGERWFPYSTVYSQESGSGWYSMPEKTDRVRLYLPERDEKEVYSASSVDLESADPEERRDPNKKVIHNCHGQKMTFAPTYVQVECSCGPDMTQYIKMEEDFGVEIYSPKNMSFKAANDITVSSTAGDVVVSSPNEVTIEAATAKIRMNESIYINGEKVIVQ